MMTRREFLHGAGTALLMVPVVGAGCGSTMSPQSDGGLTPQDGGAGCQGVFSTGSYVPGGIYGGGHLHTLCVPSTDLTSPPAAGATYTTSTNEGHTHTVTLSQAQLQTIDGGGTVTVDSSDIGHLHTFNIKKA